jgi:hypothetical protein
MWARLENSRVVEIVDTDPVGRYHPDLVFVSCDVSTQINDVMSGGIEYDAELIPKLKAIKTNEIDAAYNAAISVISSSYPETERNSWAKQEQEARAWIANGSAATPLLSAIAAARGTSLTDIAARVIANADAYAVYAGGVIGKRQAKMIAIAAATTIAELEAITW